MRMEADVEGAGGLVGEKIRQEEDLAWHVLAALCKKCEVQVQKGTCFSVKSRGIAMCFI